MNDQVIKPIKMALQNVVIDHQKKDEVINPVIDITNGKPIQGFEFVAGSSRWFLNQGQIKILK